MATQQRSKSSKQSTSLSTRQINSIFKKFEASAALLADGDIKAAEAHAQQVGVNRRIAFAVLTKSGKELIEMATKDDDSALMFAKMVVIVKDGVEALKGLQQLMETAHIRLNLALCKREDMSDLLERAALTVYADDTDAPSSAVRQQRSGAEIYSFASRSKIRESKIRHIESDPRAILAELDRLEHKQPEFVRMLRSWGWDQKLRDGDPRVLRVMAMLLDEDDLPAGAA